MTFFKEFKKRGYLYQCTNIDVLEKKLNNQKIVAYIGFDCTAKSLHIGSLMQIMILRLLQQYGHKPIVLIGGATTKIGDPTGKEKERQYLKNIDVVENMIGIQESLSKFIKFGDGPSDAMMLNNSKWLDNIGYIEFLRNAGRMFSVNKMLKMDSVSLRLTREQSLTFLEFNYMLLQAYDFYYLNKQYNCELQIGGSDQWGNIITGVDFIRKMSGNEGFGLTTPLLTTASGTKMGKSVSGAIWLNESALSTYDYYQYWRNIEDSDVVKFAKLYCEFNDHELEEFKKLSANNINEAKKHLAYVVTTLCHGQQKAHNALQTSIQVFEQGVLGQHDLPTVKIKLSDLEKGILCTHLLHSTGLTSSKTESKKLIRGKGLKVNNQQITDENFLLDTSDLIEGVVKISVGKKKHLLIKVSETN